MEGLSLGLALAFCFRSMSCRRKGYDDLVQGFSPICFTQLLDSA